MTLTDILIGSAVVVAWALTCFIVKRIFECVRAARWRRIREPRCHGDEGGHPVTGKAGD
jgi:hypothetical protein